VARQTESYPRRSTRTSVSRRLPSEFRIPHAVARKLALASSDTGHGRSPVAVIAGLGLAVVAEGRAAQASGRPILDQESRYSPEIATFEPSRVSRSARYVSTAANQVSNKGFSDNDRTGIGGRGGWTG
jgi:hypothetical protein